MIGIGLTSWTSDHLNEGEEALEYSCVAVPYTVV